ncbi:MAG: hypothetical protein JO317_04955, partial [Verrucomicrobiae bacterium]|nr:hypothetical protein [Verrucomicrobiae bacterium]
MQFFASSSSGAEPIAWWKNRPVYLAFVLVGVNLAAIVATALLQAVKAFGVLSLLGLNYPYAMHGEIWRFLTFPFVQPLGAGNMAGPFWTLISLLMLGRFGFLIEQSIGWGRLLRLYLLLVLTPIVPIVLLGGKIPAYFGTT